jgi:hypothetical protein
MVLGAGASAPYGFPLGPKLVTDILKFVRSPSEQTKAILAYNDIDRPEAYMFADLLEGSGMYSIDAFLEDRKEFLRLGKLAIAAILAPLEIPKKIHGNWYQYLFNTLCLIKHQSRSEPLTILTFNYDRSLEFYLRRAFRCKTGLPEPEIDKLFEKIKFIYLHGNLGDLTSGHLPGRKFDSANSTERFSDVAASIKIIHEPQAQNLFQTAVTYLTRAESIYIMGFSFHPLNIERLFPKGLERQMFCQEVVATALDLTASEQQRIKGQMNIAIRMTDMDCLRFLREHPVIA